MKNKSLNIFLIVSIFSAISCTFQSNVAPTTSESPGSSSGNQNYNDCTVGAININPCVLKQSGVAVVSDFGADILNWTRQGTTIKAPIPNGFYANHFVEFTETNLIPSNIVSGVSIFGVTGTASINCDSTISFAGITTITSVSAVSATINWVNVGAAKSYLILDVTNASSPKIAGLADAGQSQKILSNLTSNTNYTFKVKALSSSGQLDCNSATTSTITSSQTLPSDISGLSIWLKNESLNSFSNSDPVTQWNDNSSHNRHFQQSSAASQPVYVSNQLNNLGGVEFDGANDFLEYSGADYANVNFTVFIVALATSSHQNDGESTSSPDGVSGQKYLIDPTFKNADGGMGLSFGTNGIGVYEHGNGYLPCLANYAASFLTSQVITVSYSGNQPSIYINGNLSRTGLTSPRPSSIAPSTLGGSSSSYGFFKGMVFEVVVYNRTLNGTERANVESYLRNKFAL